MQSMTFRICGNSNVIYDHIEYKLIEQKTDERGLKLMRETISKHPQIF